MSTILTILFFVTIITIQLYLYESGKRSLKILEEMKAQYVGRFSLQEALENQVKAYLKHNLHFFDCLRVDFKELFKKVDNTPIKRQLQTQSHLLELLIEELGRANTISLQKRERATLRRKEAQDTPSSDSNASSSTDQQLEDAPS